MYSWCTTVPGTAFIDTETNELCKDDLYNIELHTSPHLYDSIFDNFFLDALGQDSSLMA